MSAKKLNSMRFLEREGIAYEVIEFDESIHSAEGVAAFVGVPPNMVYKTLVVIPEGSNRPMLILASGERSLDLKKVAQGTGHKKVRMAAHQEAEKLTGLKVGGISALALTAKNWTVYIDQPVTELDYLLVSAGQRGVNLKIAVADLIRVLQAQVISAT